MLFIRRVWVSRRAVPPVTRWLLTWGSVAGAAGLLLFGATAIALDDGGEAIEIALGLSSPYGCGWSWLTVPLALLGWAAAPALIGAVVSLIVSGQIERQRMTEQEIRELEERVVDKVRAGGSES